MAQPSSRTTDFKPRTLLPLAATIGVIAVLAAMVILPLWSSNEAQKRREHGTQNVTTFRFSLDAYHLDIVRLAAEERAYAATRSPGSRERYFDALNSLAASEDVLLARARNAGFVDETNALVAMGHSYEDVVARIVTAEDAGNDVESLRLVEQEGEPQLVEIDSAASNLKVGVDEKRAELRAAIDRVDRRERIAIGVAAVHGLIAAGVVGWLVLSNARLSRRALAEGRRLDDVISDVPGIVWQAWGRPDATTQRIDFVSRHVEEMLGYSVEEWLSTPNFWLTIVHPDDREGAAARSAAAFAWGGSSTNSFRWIAKDGRVLYIQAYSTVITDDRGDPVGMRGVSLDVTDQRRAEQAHEQERARFASIIASIDYGVYQVDAAGRLTYLNPAAEEMFGCAAADVMGLDTHAVFHYQRADGSPIPIAECPIYRSARAASSYRGTETFSRKDGRTFPVEIACAAVIVDGQPSGSVVVFQDITTRLKREQQKDDFVAFASHELRSPLTSVKGFARWLDGRARSPSSAFDPDEREAIATLVDEADRMESIIELFLDLARLESDRLPLDLEPVDLRRILDDELERLQTLYPLVTCDATFPDEHIIALLDNHRVRQVVGNLLDNAAKYSGDAGAIAVIVSVEPGWSVVRIRDDGPGIPLDDQPFVFDRYYRGAIAAASQRRGLGVGLFITKQLVDRMGGMLSFISAPGSGTEFILRLPLVTLDEDDGPSDLADLATDTAVHT